MTIKFDIKSIWTRTVIFTAEIEVDEGTSYGVKLGLAVKMAVKARADLARADLARANLTDADLTDANLTDANLAGANLAGANLAGANLAGANLTRANLAGANLAGADLTDANLTRANLAGANLAGADLNGVSGLNDWIKCIQVEDWPINYTSEVMQIGCQRHTFDAWRNFSDAKIRAMDWRRALTFWAKNKDWLFKTIEMFPARPTNAADPDKTEASL